MRGSAMRGGPGSRGGKVIGQTKTGRPIYAHALRSATKMAKIASMAARQGGSHEKAAAAHKVAAELHDKANRRGTAAQHLTAAAHHESIAKGR